MKKKLLLFIFCLTVSFVKAQNTCATALPVVAGLTVINEINGSQVPVPLCTGTTPGTAGEWYVYSSVENHTVTITTDLPVNIGDDPRVHIYNGTCGNLTCIAGDDDSGVLGNPAVLAVITFNALQGQTYFIAFDNKWDSLGVTFNLIENPFIEPSTSVSFTQQSITLTGTYKDCVVDMDGDYLDDIVAVSSSQVHILKQKSDSAGFTSATISTPVANFLPAWSIAAGDIDNDGYNDLLYGSGQGVSFMKQNDTGTAFTLIQPSIYVFSQRSNFVDIDNDGNLDAFVCHDVQPNIRYMNDGNGGFSFTQGGMGDFPTGGNYGSIFVDYDNDGDSDLFIAKCRGGNTNAKIDELHRNDGNGIFTNVSIAAGMAEPSQSWSSAWADYDNDGDMDAMIGASSTANGGHKLRRNNGNGTFTDITVGSGLDTFPHTNIENVAHDFNNDGFVDIFMGNNTIMVNKGDFTFAPNPINTQVGSIGDLNHDGFLDIQYNNNVFYNTGNSNNWLIINLHGIESNRNGIGARVEIYGDWGKQIRDVRSGDGFRHMSSLNVHFGIGTATMISKLVIRWPSGIVDEILNPAINQRLLVVESATLGIKGNTDNNDFRIYPNPASDFIRFELNTGQAAINKVDICDLSGRIVLTSDAKDQSVDVHSLTSGVYILILKNDEGKSFSRKFIKK